MTLKKSEWSNWKSTLTEYKTVVAEFSSVCTWLVLKQHWLHILTLLVSTVVDMCS